MNPLNSQIQALPRLLWILPAFLYALAAASAQGAYEPSTRVSECVIALDPEAIDSGLGYSIGVEEVFDSSLKSDVRTLFKHGYAQRHPIRFAENEKMPSLVNPFSIDGDMRLKGNRIILRWHIPSEIRKEDRAKFRRVGRRLARYAVDLMLQSVPNIRGDLWQWQDVYVNSIRYFLKPGTKQVGLPLHRDGRGFQMLVEFNRPKTLRNGSLHIRRYPDGNPTFERTFGPEYVNRGVMIGGQSNYHGVEGFDFSAGKQGSPMAFRDLISISISPRKQYPTLDRGYLLQDGERVYP